MKISLEWLRQYATLDAPVDTLVQALVDAGIEVDRIHRGPQGVIVVRVVGLAQVPDKNVQFVEIETGDGVERLITGATNLHIGDLVPWAPPGTLLPGWDRALEVRTFFQRYQSPGMLCSAAEVGVGDDAAGILLLEHGRPGEPLHTAFPMDVVLDVEPTTNRPDSMCHLGIARELAAALAEPLTTPLAAVPPALSSAVPADGRADVHIEDAAGCRRFSVRIIDGLRVGPSPPWLQRRLRSIGQNPINNVVDITNFVAAEWGQPLHAFDLDRFVSQGGDAGAHVVVRRGRAGETVACLDRVDREVGSEDLVVAASGRAVSIAGIIGGATTAVDGSTRTVLLEAAAWDSGAIRASSRRLGRRTEASALFEKGLSDTLPPTALDRAAGLIAELGHGHVLHGVIDAQGQRLPTIAPIDVDTEWVSRLLGIVVDADEAAIALVRLGFEVEHEASWLRVTPPHFRRDVTIREDVAEEIGRCLGYARIAGTLPGRRSPVTAVAEPRPLEDRLRDICTGAGYDEAITYSLSSPRVLERVSGLGGGRLPIRLRNPLSDDWSVLRTSVLAGLCQALAGTLHHGVADIALFEIGRAYWEGERNGLARGSTPDGFDLELVALPAEPLLLAVAAHGADANAAAHRLRGVQSLLQWMAAELSGSPLSIDPDALPGMHPGRSGRLRLDGHDVGVIGELDRPTTAALDVHGRILVAELDVDAITPERPRSVHYTTPSKLPAVVQDLAVSVLDDVPAGRALAVIRHAGGALLETVDLYDEYRGQGIEEGHKSWTFRLTFRAPDHTLTGADANAVQDDVVTALQRECGADVRH